MKKEEFNRRIKALTDELAKYGIEVHVDRDINPEQLSCEFYNNNESLGYIWFTKENRIRRGKMKQKWVIVDCRHQKNITNNRKGLPVEVFFYAIIHI